MLIYDETECYFEGYVKQMYEDQYAFIWSADKPLILHKPWMDASFIKDAYDSELDFIIWFFPYKPHSFLTEKEQYEYPDLVILDTRYPRSDFVQYNESALERM